MPLLFSRSRLITVNEVPVKNKTTVFLLFGFEYQASLTFVLAEPKGKSKGLTDKAYKRG
jgi:hypothetical protein